MRGGKLHSTKTKARIGRRQGSDQPAFLGGSRHYERLSLLIENAQLGSQERSRCHDQPYDSAGGPELGPAPETLGSCDIDVTVPK